VRGRSQECGEHASSLWVRRYPHVLAPEQHWGSQRADAPTVHFEGTAIDEGPVPVLRRATRGRPRAGPVPWDQGRGSGRLESGSGVLYEAREPLGERQTVGAGEMRAKSPL
jgi:hypothetical protein